MPVISDPGIPLIRQCLEEGIEVDVLPGATAFVNALVLSGLAADSFTFYGFLPRKQSELRRKLAEIKPRKEVFIIYEAPHRIVKTLTELKALLGNRQVVLARELTKMHEEVLRMDIASLMEELTLHPRKGEMVLLVSGAPEEEISTTIEQELISLLELGMSKNDAIKAVAQSRHVAKREVYQVAMKLK
jgi:16S rRNA (cytidine1402-2'-O)-methyltransferase